MSRREKIMLIINIFSHGFIHRESRAENFGARKGNLYRLEQMLHLTILTIRTMESIPYHICMSEEMMRFFYQPFILPFSSYVKKNIHRFISFWHFPQGRENIPAGFKRCIVFT